MEKLIARLNTILQKEFPGSEPDLEYSKYSHKVGGFLLWKGFTGVEQIDRQRRLSAAIKKLPESDRKKLTMILTFTPAESIVSRAG